MGLWQGDKSANNREYQKMIRAVRVHSRLIFLSAFICANLRLKRIIDRAFVLIQPSP